MASITAIIPTYNRADFLTDALNGLTGQTHHVEEIIVWDDGSTDRTEDVVKSFASPIRYFRSANGGKAKALNAALREARGDLIWICDDDDIALPGAAECLVGLLDRTPGAGAAAGSYVRFRQDPETGVQVESGPGYWPDLSGGSVLRHLLEDIFLFQNATIVRRDIYDRAGPFRENLARSIDYDMLVRLGVQAPIAVTEQVVFRQRKHDGARGPAAARHDAARSDAVWKDADKAVFRSLRDTITPALCAGFFDGDLSERAGRMQRACIYARRTDWPLAMEEFRAAAALFPETALSPVERGICLRAMAGKHGIAEVLLDDTRLQIVQMARSGPVGAAIARALARGAVWRSRVALGGGRLAEAASVGRFVASLSLAGQRREPPMPAPELTERRTLETGFYASLRSSASGRPGKDRAAPGPGHAGTGE